MHFDFEKHLAETQRLTRVGTWEWVPASDSLAWSDEHYRLFGLCAATFTPSLQAVLPFVHPADVARVQEILQESIRGHTPFVVEYRVLRADGSTITLLAHGAWEMDEHNGAVHMYGTAQDITERKRAEDALRESERQLRILLEERERIARDLHDDLIQNLYAIGMMLEAAQSGAATARESLQPTFNTAIEGLNKAIAAARALVEGTSRRADVELEQELQSIALAAERVRSVKVSLKLDREPLSALATESHRELVNIVREAVSNAVRHSSASHVIVSVEQRGRGVQLRIEDNGEGFDVDARRRAGHGLRNMTVRARAVSGNLKIEADPSRGTVITVDIAQRKA